MLARKHRIAALVLAFIGAVLNAVVANRLVALWRSFRLEADSEWEASASSWGLWGVKIVWGLLAAYFATAAVACLVGVVGVLKRIPSYVRLYRDYSIADLAFCAVATVLLALAPFRPDIRTTVCEEFSRQPELLRELSEAGLNMENCEQWFEHAVIAVVGIAVVLLVIRLQFILTVSTYYKYLQREHLYTPLELTESPVSLQLDMPSDSSDSESSKRQRIYLLPSRPQSSSGTASSSRSHAKQHTSGEGSTHGHSADWKRNVLVYAPVPLASLTEEEARELHATEAWVTIKPSSHSRRGHGRSASLSFSSSRSHSHQHSQSHSHSTSTAHSHTRRHTHSRHHSHSVSNSSATSASGSLSGRISLPIHQNEGLLPSYNDVQAEVHAHAQEDVRVNSGSRHLKV